MAFPSHLGLAHDGNDVGKVCLPLDLHARDFVLPADVEKVSEVSEIEVVMLFFMSSLCGAGFRTVE